MTRRLAPLAGVLLASLALAACGEKTDQLTPTSAHSRSLSVMLDRSPNADHVGLYRALADGGLEAAGLNVTVRVPAHPATSLALLQAGKVVVAIASEPELMLARDKGAPLVAIGAIVQRPLSSIISLRFKHITSPAQLSGRRVGDAGVAYQHAFLQTVLQHAGVPAGSVHEVNVGSDLVGSLLSGHVAATLGAGWNDDAIRLQQAGKHPNVIHLENAGVPTYDELVLVTTENDIANRNTELRLFVQALGRGFESVRADPQAGVDTLVKANPSLNIKLQQASVAATLPAFFPSTANRPWGWMTTAQWTAFGQWMLREHLISNPATIVGAETDQLLAGQGP